MKAMIWAVSVIGAAIFGFGIGYNDQCTHIYRNYYAANDANNTCERSLGKCIVRRDALEQEIKDPHHCVSICAIEFEKMGC